MKFIYIQNWIFVLFLFAKANKKSSNEKETKEGNWDGRGG